MPVSEIPLKEGLKIMFTTIAASLYLASKGDPREFERTEDELVDAFLGGLRTNGYEIREIEQS